MNNSDEQLYITLKQNVSYCKFTSRRDHIMIRCPFCGDSIKHKMKGHLYIKNEAPYPYYCQKCESSGKVNGKFLSMLNIDDIYLVNKINSEYKKYKDKIKVTYKKELNFLKKQTFVKFPSCRPKELFKKEYLENRLGIQLDDFNDNSKYKIVYNIIDFFTQNNIDLLEKNKNNKYYMSKIYELANNYVGFLSYDKSTIIFRNASSDQSKYRYVNFTLFPELDSKKTYILSNKVDINKPVFKIIITEGILDIIGVYNHIYNKEENDSTMYIANCGKSFLVTINLLKSLSILNSDLYIYSDADVNIDTFKHLMRMDDYFKLNGINIYYNNIGKDYGVPKDQIKLSNLISL